MGEGILVICKGMLFLNHNQILTFCTGHRYTRLFFLFSTTDILGSGTLVNSDYVAISIMSSSIKRGKSKYYINMHMVFFLTKYLFL